MNLEKAIEAWELVNDGIEPKSLVDARLQAHWAAQIIGGVGEALVTPVPDFSHTSMNWVEEHRALAGQMTSVGVRLGLQVAAMTIVVIDDANETVESLSLPGHTLANALLWTIGVLERRAGSTLPAKIEIPNYEMPSHAVSLEEPFLLRRKAHFEELARWYANAARFESVVHENTLGASPVRCWPHHFDIASLVSLDGPGANPESARSIGFGLSPGDSSYDQPYFYINPWPFPETLDDAPALDGNGHWHSEGWFGAVLPASALNDNDPRRQAEQVAAYVRSAMAADRAILGTL